MGAAQRHQPDLLHPLHRCPSCGSGALEAVVEDETRDVNFLCTSCKRCWHVELGFAHRVTPNRCHGCPHHDECLRRYEADLRRMDSGRMAPT